jgi:putative ABC transport system ATP-binding protein
MGVAALEATGLQKHYRTPDGATALVLDVPAFTLAAGEHMALRGASGSGKTTFLHCLAGILAPDAGTVWVDVGYVFQTFNLLQGLTALENVLLAQMVGAGVDGPRALELLVRVGLGDRARYRPAQLSVGQQQRVAVARALANRPAVVLADEPTGNLDPARAREAMALIRAVCAEAGAALLVVSHSEEVLAGFARVERLEDVNHAAPVPLEPIP